MAFAVSPKYDCPHVATSINECLNFERINPCLDCGNVGENWLCLFCSQVFCSRYVKAHMAAHNEATHHPVAMSMADLSFWCYACDSYIMNSTLLYIRTQAAKSPAPHVDIGPGSSGSAGSADGACAE